MCNLGEGIAERAARDRSISIALTMIDNGEDNDKIIMYTGLTLQDVQTLRDSQLA